MKTQYRPHNIESHWYHIWENHGYFKPTDSVEDPYCMVIPPPNVTGRLHMGHAFQHTLMDVLIRYHRMHQNSTLWQVGVDHAGIATQILVENKLREQGITAEQLGRDALIQHVWQWQKQSGNMIKQQMRRLGNSVDWLRERFTMDESFSYAVTRVFVQLYEQGLIYRGERLINWDPSLQTAISDLEVTHAVEKGHMWHLRYPIAHGNHSVVVATTRPETLLGDMAVAVHPDDPRYQHLIGQQIRLPLTDRIIPILADEAIDPDVGTGCVKITPAHDFNDYDIAQRHNLTVFNIWTKQICANENVPLVYQGLDRDTLRQRILKDLGEQNLLVQIEPHEHAVPRSDRSGAMIEPRLTSQWFMRMKPLAEPAIHAIRQGQLRFVPEHWTKTYLQWLENIEDWCISRQLWWGHRIPAWYDAQEHVYVGHDESQVRQRHHLNEQVTPLSQDPDVLDTWFSSALWPFVTQGWPEQTIDFKRFYPTQVLVTGFDIIFFWVARMVMMGLHLTGVTPFHTVYITGLIRDPHGKKMSKSKGNVIDPIDLIDGISLEQLVQKRTEHLLQPHMKESIAQSTQRQFPDGIPEHGTDALRFTLCALANTGRDICFDFNRLMGYRNFCNKLWNAARYVQIQCDALNADEAITTWLQCRIDPQKPIEHKTIADGWILTELHKTIDAITPYYEAYRFDKIAQRLHEFTWHSFCDWSIECAKVVLHEDLSHTDRRQTTVCVLLYTLETLLRLLHPMIPFITEDLWQRFLPYLPQERGQPDTIMLQTYPKANMIPVDSTSHQGFQKLQQIITQLRTLRSEYNLSPQQAIPLFIQGGSTDQRSFLQSEARYLIQLAHLSELTILDSDTDLTFKVKATLEVEQLRLSIPLEACLNVDEYKKQSSKKIKILKKNLEDGQRRLNHPNYLAKAPADVITQQRHDIEQWTIALKSLEERLRELS